MRPWARRVETRRNSHRDILAMLQLNLLLALLAAFVPTAAAQNWEDAACWAIAGNTTKSIDGPPQQVRAVPGRNASSYVVSWISHLTLIGNEDLTLPPRNDWPQLKPSSHGNTFRNCLVKVSCKANRLTRSFWNLTRFLFPIRLPVQPQKERDPVRAGGQDAALLSGRGGSTLVYRADVRDQPLDPQCAHI